MSALTTDCALCGPTTHGAPVVRVFDGEQKHFCCPGCAGVYERARQSASLDDVLASPANRANFAQLIRRPGETLYFTVTGMRCAGCAIAAERLLRNQPGVTTAEISFAAERGRVQFDPARAEGTALLNSLDRIGYHARGLGDAREARAERRQEWLLLQLITALAFGMQVMNLSFGRLYPAYANPPFDGTEVRQLQYLLWLLATPALFYGGSSFLLGAWRALRARTATMDTLVSLGTLSAYGYSAYVSVTGNGQVYFDSVTMITAFVMLGRYMETLGGAQARKDVRKLLSVQPEQALRRSDGIWHAVPSSTLVGGDVVLVKPGERMPADAAIEEGEAALDEALLTGESTPHSRRPGDMVAAGTLVLDGALVCCVIRAPQEGRLAVITRLVEQTLAAKPPIQRMADTASAYFTVVILGVALLAFVGWWGLGYGVSRGLLAAVAVLVVACPCALGLATPFALSIVVGRAARSGVLVRNLAALESAAGVGRVAFDKTGTLTRGMMTVDATVTGGTAEIDEGDLLRLAAAVEQFSEHPVARAIVAACPGPPGVAADFQVSRGRGASAIVPLHGNRRLRVGSRAFVGGSAPATLMSKADMRTAMGETIAWVGWAEEIAGFIALRDEPNPTARDALRRLTEKNIRVVLLSGDHPRTSAAVAAELGISEFQGGRSPEEKAEQVRRWQSDGERVAMVGDGINDAPPLAQADLSVAMGSGTDVAGETSDIVLLRLDLTLVPWFIELSGRTRRIIRGNLAWAFGYNLLLVPLAAVGMVSPAIAALSMSVSSLLVVGNSLRLRR